MKLLFKFTYQSLMSHMLLFLAAAPVCANDEMHIQQFSNEGREYNLVSIYRTPSTIETTRTVYAPRRFSREYLAWILGTLQTWLVDQMISAGTFERNSKTHRQLMGPDSILHSESSNILFVTERNDLSRIHGLIRAARKVDASGYQYLPLEEAGFHADSGVAEHIFAGLGRTIVMRGELEIKNFMVPRYAPRGLRTFLFYRAAMEGSFFSTDDGSIPATLSARTNPSGARAFRSLGFRTVENVEDQAFGLKLSAPTQAFIRRVSLLVQRPSFSFEEPIDIPRWVSIRPNSPCGALVQSEKLGFFATYP